jgi:hypothetical protein
MATFEMIREKYQKAQGEQQRELEQDRKLLSPNKKEYIYGSDDPLVKPRPEKNSKLLKKLIILLNSKKLRNMLKQNQADEITAKENR